MCTIGVMEIFQPLKDFRTPPIVSNFYLVEHFYCLLALILFLTLKKCENQRVGWIVSQICLQTYILYNQTPVFKTKVCIYVI